MPQLLGILALCAVGLVFRKLAGDEDGTLGGFQTSRDGTQPAKPAAPHTPSESDVKSAQARAARAARDARELYERWQRELGG